MDLELCRQAGTKDSHVGVLYGEVIVEFMEGGCRQSLRENLEEYLHLGNRRKKTSQQRRQAEERTEKWKESQDNALSQ